MYMFWRPCRLETLRQVRKNSEENFFFPEDFFWIEERKKQVSRGKQMFSGELFCTMYNVFSLHSTEHIFLLFHSLTHHNSLHFGTFCFKLTLQIFPNHHCDNYVPQ